MLQLHKHCLAPRYYENEFAVTTEHSAASTRVGCILTLQESNKGRGSIVSISSCCPSNAKFITRLNKITENNIIYMYRKGNDEHF